MRENELNLHTVKCNAKGNFSQALKSSIFRGLMTAPLPLQMMWQSWGPGLPP